LADADTYRPSKILGIGAYSPPSSRRVHMNPGLTDCVAILRHGESRRFEAATRRAVL